MAQPFARTARRLGIHVIGPDSPTSPLPPTGTRPKSPGRRRRVPGGGGSRRGIDSRSSHRARPVRDADRRRRVASRISAATSRITGQSEGCTWWGRTSQTQPDSCHPPAEAFTAAFGATRPPGNRRLGTICSPGHRRAPDRDRPIRRHPRIGHPPTVSSARQKRHTRQLPLHPTRRHLPRYGPRVPGHPRPGPDSGRHDDYDPCHRRLKEPDVLVRWLRKDPALAVPRAVVPRRHAMGSPNSRFPAQCPFDRSMNRLVEPFSRGSRKPPSGGHVRAQAGTRDPLNQEAGENLGTALSPVFSKQGPTRRAGDVRGEAGGEEPDRRGGRPGVARERLTGQPRAASGHPGRPGRPGTAWLTAERVRCSSPPARDRRRRLLPREPGNRMCVALV